MRSALTVLAAILPVFCACGSDPAVSGGTAGASGSAASGAGAAGNQAQTGGGSSSAGSAGAPASGASAGAASGGALAGGAGGVAPGSGIVPNQEQYLKTLYELCDLLLTTQIDDAQNDNDGALVSPSTNPDPMPIHSRAAEAVYPLAVAFKHSQDEKYANAAVRLGDWLITVQADSGLWIEEWPATSGWDGTTADQLISLANAYALLKNRLTPGQDTAWVAAITRAADWISANFPKGNINYVPTGAVALVSASHALASPKAGWLPKAASLMATTLDSINDDTLLTGEGGGDDLGYNIAQSIGMIALYGRMLDSKPHLTQAADLLKAHQHFMYPSGAIDNSWGTRSFKWTLESGTKTAPGIFFSFALVADQDPSFQRGAQLALSYLYEHGQDDQGWLVYGPHADRHPTSNPPSNYGTFARAQSIATAVEFAPEAADIGSVPADEHDWLQHFPSVKTAVFRTGKLMATVTSYGAIATYPRESMARGGSVSALWFEGYGSSGFLQVSSQTVYSRLEPKHMPVEQQLLPLTPRVETSSGAYSTNLYDDMATLTIAQDASGVHATTGGALKTLSGASSGTSYTWTYDFGPDSYTKQLEVSTASNLRIVEPFVDDTGNAYELQGDTFSITTAAGHVYQLQVLDSSGPYTLSAGTDRARYWSPFPGLDCYPLVITLSGAGTATIKYQVSQVK